MSATLPHPKHFHDLVAEVVDDLDGDAAGFGLGKGRDVSLCRVSQAWALISALRVVLSDF